MAQDPLSMTRGCSHSMANLLALFFLIKREKKPTKQKKYQQASSQERNRSIVLLQQQQPHMCICQRPSTKQNLVVVCFFKASNTMKLSINNSLSIC